ncbi:hypothetical protein FACS189414_5390 [Bacteroidia bacterium]|nr:hypothetical protein FACS189414_5390 [Bacteroidia bacterium]
MKICKELEQEFNLIPLVKGEREFEIPKPIDYKDGDLKHRAGNTIKFILSNFHFQSFGEYKTMLEHFNLTVEEIKGLHNGIIYSVTDGKGNNVGRPLKSSLFGKGAGFEALQKHFENSKIAIEKEKIKEKLRPAIAKAMREARGKDRFRELLKEKQIGVIFRTNEQDRIYGVTFMDYQNRAVLNGSRLGKDFSANVFNDWFNSNQKPTEITKHTEQSYQNTNSDSSLGSVFGLLDMPQSDSDYEEAAFAREQEYQDKKQRLKAKRKRRRGI